MKECRICGVVKEIDDFYKYLKVKDGRDSKCKECIKVVVKVNRDKNIDYYRKYDFWRFKNDFRVRECYIRYRDIEFCKVFILKF